MNLLEQKFEGCAPRRYVSCQAKAIDLATRCYVGGMSSSTTSQPVTNEQVGLELQNGGQGIAVGAGSTTGAINIQTLSDAQLQDLTTAASDVTTTAINTSAQTAQAALAAGQNLANTAYSVTSANLNALNANTAEAFSILASMETSQQSGAVSGEAQDLAALASHLSSLSSAPATVVYQPVATDSGTGAATGSGLSWGTVALIVAGIAALIWGPKLLKAA